MHDLIGFGMGKGQLLCMETLSRKKRGVCFFKGGFSTSVNGIADDRMTYVAHMDSYLVGTSRFKLHSRVGE